MLAHPAADPKFADSKAHGTQAQLELYREVSRWCTGRRAAVDAGAHIGLWSRIMALHFAHVISFEPNAENYECLVQNTAPFSNIFTANVALGASPGTAAQKLPPLGNSGMWHITPGEDFEVLTLDSLQRTDVDLLKIDVEGFEGQVILGARQTLVASSPVVVFEDNGTGAKYFGNEWVDPKPILKSLGYKLRLRWRKDEVWLRR